MSGSNDTHFTNVVQMRRGGDTGGGNPPGGNDVEARIAKLENTVNDVQVRLVRIETRLEQTATKSDMHELAVSFHKAMNEQTWKFIAAATGLAALAFSVAKFLG